MACRPVVGALKLRRSSGTPPADTPPPTGRAAAAHQRAHDHEQQNQREQATANLAGDVPQPFLFPERQLLSRLAAPAC